MLTRRQLFKAGAAVGAASVLSPVLLSGTPAQAQEQGDEDMKEATVQTEWGPLTASDEDMLDRVYYAGLWEIPAGRLAAERGSTERVREVGRLLEEDHTELNRLTEEAAAKLGLDLPDEPLADHQNFIKRIDSKSGRDLDVEFATLARLAHGQVYPLVAYARSGTQNSVVRELANTTEEFVHRHMSALESTEAIDWAQIPPPPMPAGETARFLSTEPGGIHPLLIWGILGVAAVAGTATVIRTVRPR